MAPYTSTDLLAGVRRLGYLPDASDLSDSDLLSFADEEQVTLISGAIKLEREEHYVTSIDYALDGVTRTYPIPVRAMGRMVRGIIYVTPTGITYPCPEVDPVRGWLGRSQKATAFCHSIYGDSIVLPGPGPLGWSMRVFYLRRPSRLIATTGAAAIVQATTTTSIAIVSNYSWVTSGLLMDVVKGTIPSECSYTDLVSAANASSTTIALNSATPVDPSQIAAPTGTNARQDWLCPAETTVFPQVPVEFYPALEAAVCRRALEAIGDREGVAVVADTYAKRVQAAIDITSPRDESGGRAIVRRNSPLRSGGMWGRLRGRRWL